LALTSLAPTKPEAAASASRPPSTDLYIAARALARGAGALRQPVILDAEDAAGLQHREHLPERLGAVILVLAA
jgi:hypothetical protein